MGKTNSKNRIKRGLSVALAIPKEIFLNLPLISLIGNEELIIENYKGVLEYTDESVKINTSAGILKIEGKKMLLTRITSENISLSGSIKKMEFMS